MLLVKEVNFRICVVLEVGSSNVAGITAEVKTLQAAPFSIGINACG